jgi:hypothetical protein
LVAQAVDPALKHVHATGGDVMVNLKHSVTYWLLNCNGGHRWKRLKLALWRKLWARSVGR